MKFIVSTSALSRHLQSITGVLSTNNLLPILECVHFEIRAGKLYLTASDLHITMKSQLEVEGKEEGIIAIPGRILMETLKALPEQPVVFDVNLDNHQVVITTENGKYSLGGEDPANYPIIPAEEQVKELNIPSDVLSNALSKTLFAVGSDDIRPAMMGIYVKLENDQASFVATDAHKLVRVIQKNIRPEQEAGMILPRKAMQLLKGALPEDSKPVVIKFNASHAFFTMGPLSLICRLIDEKYPDYEGVIPKNNPNAMTINRELFLNSMKRVSIFSNKNTHQVKLKLGSTELQLSGEDSDYSNAAVEKIACTFQGDPMEIGFNARFLQDILANMDGEEIKMELSTPNRAGLVLPVEEDKDCDVLMLVMPVMLNN